jgi:Siroheme synthase (precorrin-2 oxidase/ferrochelatase domain)
MINFNLDIAQRKILIVGAGNVAKRRLKKILKSSKDIKINICFSYL